MHIFFSGMGGTAIGPLALIAHQAGFEISGSDKQMSDYVAYLESKGLQVTIGQTASHIESLHAKHPIDWFVYSSALPRENPNHPELLAIQKLGIKHSKRDEFLNFFLHEKKLDMIAIAGTHGKTTTTAMTIWLMKKLGIPVSYSVGAKISFGDMGAYDPDSRYFVYEADEYDRNFLSFQPKIAIIPGIAYDHPDIYPTKEDYNQAFLTFICGVGAHSGEVYCFDEDLDYIDYPNVSRNLHIELLSTSTLLGEVNRRDALLVANALAPISGKTVEELYLVMNDFPGVSRRFEKIRDGVYSDYAHTPEKVRGALQLAREVAGEKVVIIYEGLHNTRQHHIMKELKTLFAGVAKLYVVPSYLAREDTSLELLTPEKLVALMEAPEQRLPSQLDESLRLSIVDAQNNGFLVVAFSAGGGGSLDEWLRRNFTR